MQQLPTISLIAPAGHLPLRVRPAVALSDDELFDLCAINRELRIERTRDGELVIMTPTGGDTGRRNFTLLGRFFVWVESDGSGVGFDSSTGFLLPNGAERSPDAAWMKKTRWEALSPAQRTRFVPLCPDFVVELRSPSEALSDLLEKMEEYRECGAALGWLIDPVENRVHIFQPGLPALRIEKPAELRGDPLLNGFVLKLGSICD